MKMVITLSDVEEHDLALSMHKEADNELHDSNVLWKEESTHEESEFNIVSEKQCNNKGQRDDITK